MNMKQVIKESELRTIIKNKIMESLEEARPSWRRMGINPDEFTCNIIVFDPTKRVTQPRGEQYDKVMIMEKALTELTAEITDDERRSFKHHRLDMVNRGTVPHNDIRQRGELGQAAYDGFAAADESSPLSVGRWGRFKNTLYPQNKGFINSRGRDMYTDDALSSRFVGNVTKFYRYFLGSLKDNDGRIYLMIKDEKSKDFSHSDAIQAKALLKYFRNFLEGDKNCAYLYSDVNPIDVLPDYLLDQYKEMATAKGEEFREMELGQFTDNADKKRKRAIDAKYGDDSVAHDKLMTPKNRFSTLPRSMSDDRVIDRKNQLSAMYESKLRKMIKESIIEQLSGNFRN